ncbi:MAG: mechanosensitive ion channel [Rickettsiales bacterium]|nr:mechanosensitive ion channel [Rickettsiales bacterium]
MNHFFSLDLLPDFADMAWAWFEINALTYAALVQAALLSISLLGGALLRQPLVSPLRGLEQRYRGRWFETALQGLRAILFPMCSLFFLWICMAIAVRYASGSRLLSIASTLTVVWIGVRFVSSFVRERRLARLVALIIWSIAALDILELLTPAIDQLEAIGFTLGKSRITLLVIFKSILTLISMLWLAGFISRVAEQQVRSLSTLTPSLRVLLSKSVRVTLLVVAFVITLNTLGIDLSSLALFSGALGVGLGFGLQKVVSNFISGIILLLDRSIKPGDVIFIHDTQTYGWVNTLGARCVSVITRDGKEHLIPNELLITEKVENWSYSSNDVRIKVEVSVSFDSDLRQALALMKEAAAAHPRVLKAPMPNALMMEIGDYAVKLELRAWIDDPINGVGNITSDLLLDIWDRFKANGIAFPYPVRDVRMHVPDIAS